MVGAFKLKAGLIAWSLGAALAIGCGNEHPRPPVSDYGPVGASNVGGGGGFGDGEGTMPPGCGTTPDGSECECMDVPLYVDPPTIYFVLDRSGSMDRSDKWTRVRVTVGKIMRALGPRANFGAATFPGSPKSDVCATGDEIMSVRAGDPPSSGVDGPTTSFLLAATRTTPSGGSPMGATLERVKTLLDKVPGQVYVILATDGAPNCNRNASCNFDECQLNIENIRGCSNAGPVNCCEPPTGHVENCNATTSTLNAIQALKASGKPVYVVGLPGTDHYAQLLDQMAILGGTALPTSPHYFAVDVASDDVMLSTLKKIAAKIAGTCSFELKEQPADATFVNVYLDNVILPYEPQNGWKIEERTVTLVGSACERVMDGEVLDVRIIAGCPRIEPR